MPDADAFLKMIREHPDEDGPRLVYADWLEEEGDPRGEFIRIQCELAKLPPTDPQRAALEEREADLLALHDYEWLGRPPSTVKDAEFSRGFVERFWVDVPQVNGLDGIMAESVRPLVTFHRTRTAWFDYQKLMDWYHLDRLGGLGWWDQSPGEMTSEIVELISSQRLARLNQLLLHSSVADQIIGYLARRPGAENLKSLALDQLSALGVQAFLGSSALNNVESLTFHSGVSAAFVHDLGLAPFRWKQLDLGQSHFRVADLAGLADCLRLTDLMLNWVEDLDRPLPLPAGLKRLHINWGGAAPLPPALPRLAVLPHLEWLYVRIDSPRPSDVANLASTLQQLNGPIVHLVALGHNLSLRDLARLPAQDRFRRLVFHCDSASDEEVRELVECGGFTNLLSFHLRCPQLTSKHVEMLAEMPFPPSLRRLTINSPLVDDAAVAKLLSSPHLQRLNYINLRECDLSSRTLMTLALLPVLPRLREVILPHRVNRDWKSPQAFNSTPGLSPLFRLRFS